MPAIHRPSRQSLFLGVVLAIFGLCSLWVSEPNFHRGWETLPNGPGSEVDLLRDANGTLTIKDVLARPASDWIRLDAGSDTKTRHGEPLWVRATVANTATTTASGVLADSEFYSDRVDFFEPGGDGSWRQLPAGEMVSGRRKPLGGRSAAFPLAVPAGETKTVYLRFEDLIGMPLRVVWWPESGRFFSARAFDTFVEGLYFGGLLVLLFYNAVLWIRLRFPDVGRYVLYLAALGSFMFVGRGELASMGLPLGSPWLEAITSFFMTLSLVFLVNFARLFLELPITAPHWDRLVRGLRILLAGMVIVSLGTPWMHNRVLLDLSVLAGLGTQLLLLVGAVLAWRAGTRQARYFVAAFVAFLLGLLPSIRIWLWPAALDDTAQAGFVMLAGSALELLLFSLAAAERFTRLQQEKLAAQVALREEAEQRRTIEEAYADELELEVRARTRELEEANHDKNRMMAVLGHDLRSPLAGLTQAAELLAQAGPAASPAKFFDDAARSGRQMLLLIEDLVLWSRIRPGELRPRPHTVRDLVEPAITLHGVQAGSRGLELQVQVAEDLRVATDLVLARTVVRNLLSNALKAARHRVVVRAEAIPGAVRLCVRDDGPGLPPAVADWLAMGGNGPAPSSDGFGLRLCSEISRVLGTRLETEPVATGGVEISFILPLAEVEVAR